MTRNIVIASMSFWLLGAPTVPLAEEAIPYVVPAAAKATGVRVECDAVWRDMAPDHRAAEGGYGKFLDRCLVRCPEVRANQPQNYYEGRVRRACDADWQRKIAAGSAETETYEDFISHCAQACPPPIGVATNPPIPELNQLASSNVSGLLFAAWVAGLATAAASDATRPDEPASP